MKFETIYIFGHSSSSAFAVGNWRVADMEPNCNAPLQIYINMYVIQYKNAETGIFPHTYFVLTG